MGWNYLSIHKLQRLRHISLGIHKQSHPILYNGCTCLSKLGFKLNQRGPGSKTCYRLVTPGEWLVKTHWGRVTHICVSKLTSIGSDNGLSPRRRQAIFWTNAGILLIGPLGTNFSETSIEIHILSFKKMHLKMSSGKWRPFCLGLNVLRVRGHAGSYYLLRRLNRCPVRWDGVLVTMSNASVHGNVCQNIKLL